MKKMKALFLCVAFCFTFAAALTIGGCKDQGGDSSSTSDWFEGEESPVVLRFNYDSVEVNQYESLALNYTLKGTVSKAEFTSSDEAVATVDENGIVTAKSILGETTIRATVDGVSASCTVYVTQSPYAPEILLNTTEYTIEEGEKLEFNVSTQWNKDLLTEDIEYAVSFAENSLNATSIVAVDGNVVSVLGGDVEKIDVIVSATVRNIYTSKLFTVNVVESKLELQPTTNTFMPSEGNYRAQISTTGLIGERTNSLPLEFCVIKGGQTLDNAAIDWTLEGDAAVIKNGAIVGQKAGTVILTGTATQNGETATVEVVCEVIPPEVVLEETYMLEVENLQTLTLATELIGTLKNAELHGVQVSSFTLGNRIAFNKAAFPRKASLLGEQKLIINTDLVRYIMDVDIYTMVINDAKELDAMLTIANTGETELDSKNREVNSQHFDGYFVLGNDIAYNKTITSMTDSIKVYEVANTELDFSRGFKGIFDGCGYNIDGMTVGTPAQSDKTVSGGLFGYLSTEGVVRNVSFTNATLLANNGFICSMGDGTIENVSISYKKIGGDKATKVTGYAGFRSMGSFFSFQVGRNANVKNCLVDASAADITVEEAMRNNETVYDVKLVGSATHIENVIVLCPNDALLAYSGGDVQKHTYSELTETSGVLSDFDTAIWTEVNGVPMFVNQANTLDRDREISFLNVEETLLVGFDMLVLVDNPYAKIEVEDIAGVTFENSILRVTEEAFGKTVTLTATSLFNSEIKETYTVRIDSFGKAVASPDMADIPVVYNTNPVLKIGDNSWMGEENYVYCGKDIVGSGTTEIIIDCEKFGWGTKSVTIVSVKNGERQHFVTDLKVWYEVGNFAESEIAVESALRDTSNFDSTNINTDIGSEEAPDGFENVTRYDSKPIADWQISSPMAYQSLSNVDLSAYEDIWFAIKIVNGYVQLPGEEKLLSNEWIHFHLKKTAETTWQIEITVDGKVVAVLMDQSGAALDAANRIQNCIATIVNGNGKSDLDGGYVFIRRNNEETTTIYATEVRGVK